MNSETAKSLKIAIVASSGGHLTQLLRLRNAFTGYSTFAVTTSEMVKNQLQVYGQVYVVGESNRQHPFAILRVLFLCFKIVWQERPAVVFSTGAAVGCLMCLTGKLFGSKVIWVDSITNIRKLSLSGRIVRYFADLILVQWEDLAARYKNVEYRGKVI